MRYKLILIICLLPQIVRAASLPKEEFRQAYCFYETEDFPAAVDGFKKLKGKLPLLEAYRNYYLADSLSRTGRLDESAALWKAFLKKFQESPLFIPAGIRYAENLFSSGRYQEAIAQSLKLLKKKESISDEELPVLYRNLATCYEKTGDKARALHYYRRLYYDFPLAEETQQTKEKRAELGRLVSPRKLPLQEKDFYHRIKILSRTFANRQRDRAIKEYQKRFPKGVYRPQVWYEISNIAYLSGKISQAKKRLANIKKKFPRHLYAQKASYRLSQVYWNKHEGNKAIREINRFLKKYPRSRWSDDALFLKARIKDSTKQKKIAVKLYKKLAQKYPQSKHVGEALWRGAWISFLARDYQKAAKLFESCSQKAAAYFTRDSGRYWSGRSREALKQYGLAALEYKKLADKQIKNYYSFQARKRLEKIRKRLKSPPPSQVEPVKRFCKHRGFHRKMELTDTLIDLLMFDQAVELLDRLVKTGCHDPAHNIALAQRFSLAGDYRKAIRAAYAYGGSEIEYRNIFPLNFRYQVFKQAETEGLDPYLVMGLIRQESVFDQEALSCSGAIGLMQIIPPTGRRLARALKIKNFKTDRLYEPEISIRLGTHYLAQHLKEFQNPALAAAAYNAGENKVRRWLKKGPIKDMTVFIEKIPYPQTRTYVKKVLSHYYNYRRLYAPVKSPGRLPQPAIQ
ncbi:MAG: transglycosylase SLT domain-containing protein [bacterium]